jgi:ribosome-associated protein
MSNEFVNQNIDKIMANAEYEFPLNLAMSSAWILGNFKGINLKILDVREISSLGDYYVIGSATNPTQANSMAEEIQFQLKRHNSPCRSLEGDRSSEWILLDHGDIIVHIFLDTTREIFDLDGRLKDAKLVTIPQEFYFDHDNEQQSINEDDKSYF